MRKRKSTRPVDPGEHLKQQALGLAAMVLALAGAYVVTRAPLLAPTEVAAPTVAEITAHIEDVSARYGVSPKLVAAIVAVESEFDPNAVSRRGAQGLMQLMPETAASLDVQDSFNPRDNLEGGVRHLKRLMDRFDNDLPLVLAAYNAGEQAVAAYRGIPPYRETRRYVVRVLLRYDPEAARAVTKRFIGPARPKPPYPRLTRVTFVRFPLSPVAVEPDSRLVLEAANGLGETPTALQAP